MKVLLFQRTMIAELHHAMLCGAFGCACRKWLLALLCLQVVSDKKVQTLVEERLIVLALGFLIPVVGSSNRQEGSTRGTVGLVGPLSLMP